MYYTGDIAAMDYAIRNGMGYQYQNSSMPADSYASANYGNPYATGSIFGCYYPSYNYGPDSNMYLWNLSPEERRRYALEKNGEYQKEQMEQNAELALYKDNLEAEKLKERKAVTAAAFAVRSILLQGKIDSFEDTWNKYIETLKTLPAVEENYLDENGEFKSEEQKRAVAIEYYGMLTQSNISEDIQMLPGAFTQGLWNGATFGFYKKDHYGNVDETINGVEERKSDKLMNDFGVAVGTTGLSTAVGYGVTSSLGSLGGACSLSNWDLKQKIQDAVDFENYNRAMKIVEGLDCDDITTAETRLKEMKGRYSQLKAASDELAGNKTTIKSLNEELKKLDQSSSDYQKKLGEIGEKIKDLKNRNTALTTEINETTKIINGEVSDEITNAKKSAGNKAKKGKISAVDIEQRLNTISSQLDDLGRVTPEMRSATTDKLKAMENSVKELDKITIAGKADVSTTTKVTNLVNGGTSVKQVAKNIKPQSGNAFSKGMLKYCKGGKGALVGLLVGAGIGIYKWCTSD